MATRIYTKTGDTGETGLFGGERVSKDDPRIEASGTVDELNAVIGLARVQTTDPELEQVLRSLQDDLFLLGADLATPLEGPTGKGRVTIARVAPDRTERLETMIDRFESSLPELRNFILPGGGHAAAALHLARVVCRRAERRCVALFRMERAEGRPGANPEILRYLNRLADLLFVLGRLANLRSGVGDIVWNGNVA